MNKSDVSEQVQTFKTSNMELAAFLAVREIPLVRIERAYRKCIFIFENLENKAQKIMLDYQNGNDQVSASKLFKSFKNIKITMSDILGEETGG